MRFAIPDPVEEEVDYVVDMDLYSSSDDDLSGWVPDLSRRRRTKLGQSIRDMLLSSDSEDDSFVLPDIDSEDEVGDILVASSSIPWREPPRQPQSKRKGKGKAPSSPPKASPSRPTQASSSSSPSKSKAKSKTKSRLPPLRSSYRWEPTMRDLIKDDQPNEFTSWMKTTEEEAFREGHRNAALQKKRLQEIDRNVRHEMEMAAHGKRSREADELQRMMEGLALRQTQEEQDTSKRFQEREQKLWADVDAAIKEAEKQLAEKLAAAAAEARRFKEEEAARIAAAEKAALARKAEAEKAAKEKAEKEAADAAAKEKAAKDEQERQAAEAKDAQTKAAEQAAGTRAVDEWRKWVGIQNTMKEHVINAVKADRAMKSSLRQGMRLITRGVGQVINTQESVVRVTKDIHDILTSQLPSPPSVSQPTTLENLASPQYGYLLSHLSKSLIKQAENEVSAKADAAFPLARIVVGLVLRGHGALADVLVARLVKKSPWVIPYFPQRAEGQARDDYEKSTGRGPDESMADYIQRQGGICTLYFAILALPYQTLTPTLAVQPNPKQLAGLIPPILRQPAAWTWIATLLRGSTSALPPSAHLLCVLLDIAGFTLLKYFRQTDKLKEAVRTASNNGKIPGDSEASRARLQLLLEGWDKKGLTEPSGVKWG